LQKRQELRPYALPWSYKLTRGKGDSLRSTKPQNSDTSTGDRPRLQKNNRQPQPRLHHQSLRPATGAARNLAYPRERPLPAEQTSPRTDTTTPAGTKDNLSAIAKSLSDTTSTPDNPQTHTNPHQGDLQLRLPTGTTQDANQAEDRREHVEYEMLSSMLGLRSFDRAQHIASYFPPRMPPQRRTPAPTTQPTPDRLEPLVEAVETDQPRPQSSAEPRAQPSTPKKRPVHEFAGERIGEANRPGPIDPQHQNAGREPTSIPLTTTTSTVITSLVNERALSTSISDNLRSMHSAAFDSTDPRLASAIPEQHHMQANPSNNGRRIPALAVGTGDYTHHNIHADGSATSRCFDLGSRTRRSEHTPQPPCPV